MSDYQTIIVGIDLSQASEAVLKKAANLAEKFDSTLHLVHVIEPLSFAYGGDLPLDFSHLQDAIHTQASDFMVKAGNQWNIPSDRHHMMSGRPDKEIHRLAKELDADLIVVGSHGRHGLSLLLGSTSSSVLHGTSCDVLAVRVTE